MLCNPHLQFQRVQMSLDNDEFLGLLKKLDDCIAYVATNPQVRIVMHCIALHCIALRVWPPTHKCVLHQATSGCQQRGGGLQDHCGEAVAGG